MRCPYCKKDDDRVVNSRVTSQGTSVKRRRECCNCGRRYTTYEHVEEMPLQIVKKGGSREKFSRKKLLDGLLKACQKRPVSAERLGEVVDEIERELRQRFENEVPSNVIGELVMDRLADLDQVAFIRFASVYREFKDVTDFVEEAEMMDRARREQEGPDEHSPEDGNGGQQ